MNKSDFILDRMLNQEITLIKKTLTPIDDKGRVEETFTEYTVNGFVAPYSVVDTDLSRVGIIQTGDAIAFLKCSYQFGETEVIPAEDDHLVTEDGIRFRIEETKKYHDRIDYLHCRLRRIEAP